MPLYIKVAFDQCGTTTGVRDIASENCQNVPECSETRMGCIKYLRTHGFYRCFQAGNRDQKLDAIALSVTLPAAFLVGGYGCSGVGHGWQARTDWWSFMEEAGHAGTEHTSGGAGANTRGVLGTVESVDSGG